MPSLRETQTLFWRLISAPEGVAQALQAAPARAPHLDRVIRGDERMSAVERLDVYANMYFFRLLDCLVEDFPALHASVGHERFHALAADYLAAHPSEHPSLRHLGGRLGAFLDGHPIGRERPWLADLARFEWALLEAFDAADAEAQSVEALRKLSEEEWAALRLELSPSLRVLRAAAPVQQVWSAVSEHHEIRDPAPEPTWLRIWREELRVFHRVIDGVEAAALRAVLGGATFARVCEVVAEQVGEEQAADRAVAMLQRWFADALVVGVGPVRPER